MAKLTTEEMLTAIASCTPLAYQLAKRFHCTNRRIPLRELNAVAMTGLKLAALKFDPSRGTKFITPAHMYIRNELYAFCWVESAGGMHVPESHEPYHAPRPFGIEHEDFHPPMTDCDGRNDLGEDFWKLVARDLAPRDAHVVIRVFRDGLEQKQAGEELGVSRARAGQLYQRAMAKLRLREDLRKLAEEIAA